MLRLAMMTWALCLNASKAGITRDPKKIVVGHRGLEDQHLNPYGFAPPNDALNRRLA
jgi:hypothetical protein